jgi:NAD(P)-dependent dehydrogenase (short-subunit alcohol dehydrogenase family)
VVSPGVIATDMSSLGIQALAIGSRCHPLHRFSVRGDVAAAVAFLVLPRRRT